MTHTDLFGEPPLSTLERSLIAMAGGDPDDPADAASTLETIVDLIEAHGRWRRSL